MTKTVDQSDIAAESSDLASPTNPRLRLRLRWIGSLLAIAAIVAAAFADIRTEFDSKAVGIRQMPPEANSIVPRVPSSPVVKATAVTASPDGRELAITLSEVQYDLEKRPSVGLPQLRFVNLAAKNDTREVITGKRCTLPRYAPGGELFAVYDFQGIGFFDPASKMPLFRFDSDLDLYAPKRLEFSKDGKWIAAIRDSDHVTVWNVQDRTLAQRISFKRVSEFHFGNDSQLLLFANHYKYDWQEWKMRGGRWSEAAPSLPLEDIYGDLSMSPNGTLFAILRRNGLLELWNVNDRKKIIEQEAHRFTENPFMSVCICFLSDSRTLITSGEVFRPIFMFSREYPYLKREYRCFTEIKAWDVESLTCVQTWRSTSNVRSIVAIPGSSDFVTLDADSNVVVWKVWR